MTDEMAAAEELKSISHQPQRDILLARCICRLDSLLPFPLSFPIGVSITECNSRDSVRQRRRHPLLIICSHSLRCLGVQVAGGREVGPWGEWRDVRMEYYLHATNERATCIIPTPQKRKTDGRRRGSQAGRAQCAESEIIYPSPRPTNTPLSGV